MAKILVTGGAGFIGSHLVDALVAKGHDVTVFDNLDVQVHGEDSGLPDYFNHEARFIKGDMRDPVALERALKGQEIIFHKAAAVGVGQSMYEIARYVEVNSLGTANLLDLIVNRFRNQIKKIIVASSMSIYGEGLYQNAAGELVAPPLRSDAAMSQGRWELYSDKNKEALKPCLTPEEKVLQPTSIYAISKKDQEEMVLTVGRSYGIPSVALRYFNVYGPRQSLSNPYTGVCAIFSSSIKNNRAPLIFEDGLQTRDFVSVHDIVRANLLALEKEGANYEALNIGTGKPVSILQIAETLAKLYQVKIAPQISGRFRSGDIRHCLASISKAKEKLGYQPQVSFEEGMKELVAWGKEAEAFDNIDTASRALEKMGLVK